MCNNVYSEFDKINKFSGIVFNAANKSITVIDYTKAFSIELCIIA